MEKSWHQGNIIPILILQSKPVLIFCYIYEEESRILQRPQLMQNVQINTNEWCNFILGLLFHWSTTLLENEITRDDALIRCREQMTGRKTYTLNFRTFKKRCKCGVVAKPGIATGSRSNKQGFIREWYPWIKGSNVVLKKHNRIHPFGPILIC